MKLKQLKAWHEAEAQRLQRKADGQADRGVAQEATVLRNAEKAAHHLAAALALGDIVDKLGALERELGRRDSDGYPIVPQVTERLAVLLEELPGVL